MKILINKVSKEEQDNIIDFTTEFGIGMAVWNGNRRAEEGKEYDVQYDITDPLIWDEDVTLSKEKKFNVCITKEGMFITGIIESVSKDGLVDLRFDNSIIQLEIEGKNIPKGQYVKVRADSLEVYDIN